VLGAAADLHYLNGRSRVRTIPAFRQLSVQLLHQPLRMILAFISLLVVVLAKSAIVFASDQVAKLE
jgi:hypothetical protein